MTSKLPKNTRVAAGQRVSAATMNAVIAAVSAGPQAFIRVGPGLTMSSSAGAVTISLDSRGSDEMVWARITARTGGSPDRADNIRYDVVGISNPNVALAGVVPHWGRPTRQGQVLILPAPVGGLCYIVRDPDDDGRRVGRLWLPEGGAGGECLWFRQCGQQLQAPAAPGSQIIGGVIVPVPPPPPPPPTPPNPDLVAPPTES